MQPGSASQVGRDTGSHNVAAGRISMSYSIKLSKEPGLLYLKQKELAYAKQTFSFRNHKFHKHEYEYQLTSK